MKDTTITISVSDFVYKVCNAFLASIEEDDVNQDNVNQSLWATAYVLVEIIGTDACKLLVSLYYKTDLPANIALSETESYKCLYYISKYLEGNIDDFLLYLDRIVN